MNKRKGMSLIVLVITILVMIILAGVVIVTLSDNNPIEKANEAEFKSSISQFKSELELHQVNSVSTEPGYNKKDLNVLYSDSTGSTESEKQKNHLRQMKKYVESITQKYANKFEIFEGELEYIGNKREEIDWAGEAGILPGEQKEPPTTDEEIDTAKQVPIYPDRRTSIVNGDIYVPCGDMNYLGHRIIIKKDKTITREELEEGITEQAIYQAQNQKVVVGSYFGTISSIPEASKGEISTYIQAKDNSGNITKTTLLNDAFRQYIYTSIQNKNGEFVIAGDYKSTSSDSYKGVFARVDANLNVIVRKVIPEIHTIFEVTETEEGNYLLAGYGSSQTIGVALLVDANGNVLKKYTNTNGNFVSGLQTKDGGYALYQTNGKTHNGVYTSKLIKLNSNFTYVKEKTINVNSNSFHCGNSIKQDGRGNIYVCGESNVDDGIGLKGGTNAKLIKLNQELDIKWITGVDKGGKDSFTNIIDTQNGYIRLLTTDQSFAPFDFMTGKPRDITITEFRI